MHAPDNPCEPESLADLGPDQGVSASASGSGVSASAEGSWQESLYPPEQPECLDVVSMCDAAVWLGLFEVGTRELE